MVREVVLNRGDVRSGDLIEHIEVCCEECGSGNSDCYHGLLSCCK